jgi:hypothetical protein
MLGDLNPCLMGRAITQPSPPCATRWSSYMRSIIAWPKPEQETSFASSIMRAKS